MGLDIVEIIVNTEETFNIKFDDNKELKDVKTVGDFYHVILSKLENIEESECIKSIIFYKLRKEIMEIKDLPRKNITPKTKIYSIFDKNNFEIEWKELKNRTKLDIPDLIYNKKITKSLSLFNNAIFAIEIVLFIMLIKNYKMQNIIIMISLIIFTVLINGCKGILFKKKYLPEHIVTISDIVEGLTADEYRKNNLENRSSKIEVWTILVDIISEQLAIDKNLITKNAKFIKDLGAE